MLDGEIKDLQRYLDDMISEWERIGNGEVLTYEEQKTLHEKY